MESEIEYLQNLVLGIVYDKNLFSIRYGNGDKVVFSVLSLDEGIKAFFNCKTIYDTIVNHDEKINKSLLYAIEFAYKDGKKYDPFMPISQNEKDAEYYIENAVFRTIIEWDLLAQLYNIKYMTIEDATKIYYKTFFRNLQDDPSATAITSYIEQKDNIDVEPWEGNHRYVNEYRNQMTHRNSPNVTTISDYDFQMRMPIKYVLKRVVEDYAKVSCYVHDFIHKFLNESINHQVNE